MHARIYLLVAILTSVVFATFQDDKISLLTAENDALRKSLEAKRNVALSHEFTAPDPFSPRYAPVATEAPMMFRNGHENNGQLQGSLASYREKIDLIESHLKRYRHEALGYQMMIAALKNEINLKDSELQDLRTSMAMYQAENQMFLEKLTQKERDLKETLALMDNRKNEATLEQKLQDLARNLRFAEADACYARAQLTEAAAHKIFFSPARKKEYLREALEGYKKAFSLGKQEARLDISTLEKSLFPPLASSR